jgi:hypothetical protein
VDPLAFDKVLVELAIGGVLLASVWRVATAVHQQAVPRGRGGRTKDSGT